MGIFLLVVFAMVLQGELAPCNTRAADYGLLPRIEDPRKAAINGGEGDAFFHSAPCIAAEGN